MITREKELKELEKRKSEIQRPQTFRYFIGMFILLCVVIMLDEFATSTPNSVQTSIINEFFVRGMGQTLEEGAASFSLLSTLTTPISILAVLFITLCDRIGRKPILIFSVLGMCAAMLTCYWSPNFQVHIIGRLLITFFIATDVHQIYLMEIAPSKNRAIFMQIVQAVGVLGVMLISVARTANTHNGELDWRGVFLVPSFACIICVVLMIFVAKETIPYLKMRIAYLEKTPEQRKKEKEQSRLDKKKETEEAGLIPALKYVLTHKTTRRLVLISIPFNFCMVTFAALNEVIMTSSGMTTEQVSAALLVYPISGALATVLFGFLADKLGRRPAGVIMAVTAVITLFLFIFTSGSQFSPYLVGVLYGIEVRCYWAFGGATGLVFKESVPTRIRASAGAVNGVLGTVFIIAGSIVVSSLLGTFGITKTCLVWSPVMMAIAAIAFFFSVPETKGVELENIQ